LAIVLATSSVAQAGITGWTSSWTDNTALDPATSGWQWSPPTLVWNVWENYVAPGSKNVAFGASGEATVDPNIHITKTVTNGSTFDWTSYQIVVSGSAGVSYVPGSASSDKFGTIGEVGNTITFSAPLTVLQGQSVTLNFDVNVPAGFFSFGIQQTPLPEPASLTLLGLAAAFLRRR
jgi:hypothetical protein